MRALSLVAGLIVFEPVIAGVLAWLLVLVLVLLRLYARNAEDLPDIKLEVLRRQLNVLEIHVKVV